MTSSTSSLPSPIIAAGLRKDAQYGIAVPVAPGIRRVLANNAKDYTGPGTNTYIVGEEQLWIIDPGPDDQAHLEAVFRTVGTQPVGGIFVTHTHQDHSPAATEIARETGAPTYGFGGLPGELAAVTEEDVDTSFTPDVTLSCGHEVGQGNWRLKAHHTPGHFPNHMCFSLPEQGVLFSGDHVMGWSTTVIVPPLGNMAEYMDSLDKLQKVDACLMLPSHGPAVTEPGRRIMEVKEHRRMRQRQIAECLASGLRSPEAIVDALYEGLTPHLLLAAKGCVEAHLEELQQRQDQLASVSGAAERATA